MMHYFFHRWHWPPVSLSMGHPSIEPARQHKGPTPAERRKNNAGRKKCERSYHTTLLDLKVLHECFIFQQKGSERTQPPREPALARALSLSKLSHRRCCACGSAFCCRPGVFTREIRASSKERRLSTECNSTSKDLRLNALRPTIILKST
jgi:hypothetical protein